MIRLLLLHLTLVVASGIASTAAKRTVIFPRLTSAQVAARAIRTAFSRRNYHIVGDPELAEFVVSKNEMPWRVSDDGSQVYNHIDGEHFLTQKDRFVNVVRQYSRVYNSSLINFFPKTYLMNVKQECETFVRRELDARVAGVIDDTAEWIFKPAGTSGHNAAGIRVFSYRMARELATRALSGAANLCTRTPFLMQQYIQSPLLYNSRRVDLRFFMIILNVQPAIVYAYEGYGRVARRVFESKISAENVASHVTNSKDRQLNNTDKPSYISIDESFKEVDVDVEWRRRLLPRLLDVVRHCFFAARPHLQVRNGYFALLGGDFVISTRNGDKKELFPYVLEWNFGPQQDLIAVRDDEEWSVQLWSTLIDIVEPMRLYNQRTISRQQLCIELERKKHRRLHLLIDEMCNEGDFVRWATGDSPNGQLSEEEEV